MKSPISICLFFFAVHLCLGQNIDSLRSLLVGADTDHERVTQCIELGRKFNKLGDKDSAKKYFIHANKFIGPIEDPLLQYKTKAYLGKFYFDSFEFGKADSMYALLLETVELNDSLRVLLTFARAQTFTKRAQWDTLKPLLEEIEEDVFNLAIPSFHVEYHNQMSFYYQGENDILSRLDELQKAKEALTPEMELTTLAINHNLTNIYSKIQAYEAALKLYKENLKMAEKANSTQDIMYSYYGIANQYNDLEKNDSAKEACWKAIKLYNETGYSQSFGFVYKTLADIFIKEGQLDSAIYYVDKGIAMSKKQQEEDLLSDNYWTKAKILLVQGDTAAAKPYLELASDFEYGVLPELDLNLARIYASEGKYEEASNILKKTWDQIKENEDRNTIYQVTGKLLKSKYEEDQKLQQLLSDQKARAQKLNFGLLAIFLLLFISSYIIFIQIQHRRRLKDLNIKLVQKNEELYQFTYICSHDLKEPIRNVSTFTGLIEYKLAKEELSRPYDEYFHHIHSGIDTLTTIISSLKAYTEIEGKQEGTFEEEHVSLGEIMEEVKSNIDEFLADNGGKLSLAEGSEPDERFVVSRNGLVLILENLVHNGIKYNDSDTPEVILGLSWERGRPIVSVEDNGVGIEEKYLDYIFRPFKTMSNKSQSNSSGLGLAICKKIMDVLGGQIKVQSKPGKGTRFELVF
ncbi:MAG: ATP-binding protein [Bacteroidia bacterium]|nr:ATP-binding protein [Bacteroidia bacterium]